MEDTISYHVERFIYGHISIEELLDIEIPVDLNTYPSFSNIIKEGNFSLSDLSIHHIQEFSFSEVVNFVLLCICDDDEFLIITNKFHWFGDDIDHIRLINSLNRKRISYHEFPFDKITDFSGLISYDNYCKILGQSKNASIPFVEHFSFFMDDYFFWTHLVRMKKKIYNMYVERYEFDVQKFLLHMKEKNEKAMLNYENSLNNKPYNILSLFDCEKDPKNIDIAFEKLPEKINYLPNFLQGGIFRILSIDQQIIWKKRFLELVNDKFWSTWTLIYDSVAVEIFEDEFCNAIRLLFDDNDIRFLPRISNLIINKFIARYPEYMDKLIIYLILNGMPMILDYKPYLSQKDITEIINNM